MIIISLINNIDETMTILLKSRFERSSSDSIQFDGHSKANDLNRFRNDDMRDDNTQADEKSKQFE
jgi:hypothetical protein